MLLAWKTLFFNQYVDFKSRNSTWQLYHPFELETHLQKLIKPVHSGPVLPSSHFHIIIIRFLFLINKNVQLKIYSEPRVAHYFLVWFMAIEAFEFRLISSHCKRAPVLPKGIEIGWGGYWSGCRVALYCIVALECRLLSHVCSRAANYVLALSASALAPAKRGCGEFGGFGRTYVVYSGAGEMELPIRRWNRMFALTGAQVLLLPSEAIAMSATATEWAQYD